MEWYWFAAIAAALAGLYYWFFVRQIDNKNILGKEVISIMALDLTKLWNVLNDLLEAGNEFVEAQVETIYGGIHGKLKERVALTETNFDDNGLKTVELGLRDKLIKLYPLEEFPLD